LRIKIQSTVGLIVASSNLRSIGLHCLVDYTGVR